MKKKINTTAYDGNQPVVRGERVFSTSLTVTVIALILVLNVLFYILASVFGLYWSPSEADQIVLTGSTDTLFESAIGKQHVNIYFCMDEDSLNNHDTGAFVHKTAQEYQKRYSNFISIEYINLITKLNSKGERVDMTKFVTDDMPILKSSVIFECPETGMHRVITDVYSSAGYADFYTLDASGNAVSYDGEEFMAGMISWVLSAEHKKAYFTTTHSEQADSSFAKILTTAGYETGTVNLRQQTVPEDCDLLIISNPRSDFETSDEGTATTELGRIEAYIKRGGSIYVSLDPYVKKLHSLEGLLAKYGIALSETEIDGKVYRDIVRDTFNAITTNGYTIVTDHADGELATAIAENMDKYSDNDVIIREAGALSLSNGAQALLTSSSSAICENGGVTTRSEGSFPVVAYNELTAEGGTASARIFVASSIYLTVSDAVVTNGYSNKDFIYSVFDLLFEADRLPYGCHSVMYDNQTLENLTMSTANLYTALVIAVPVALAAVGAVVIIRRKNR